MTKHYRAVVVGASGAVGTALTAELLGSPFCDEVAILTRRHFRRFSSFRGSSKLNQFVVDFGRLEKETIAVAGGYDVAFCTMGVGQPRKLSPEEVWRVDVEFATAFARGAKSSGVRHISLLSSAGADATSRNRYLLVKGAAEKGVLIAGIERTSLFRPSLLVTPEIRYGLQDRVTRLLFPIIAPLLPSRFHQVPVEDLGRAMRINAEITSSEAVEILHYKNFVDLLARSASRS